MTVIAVRPATADDGEFLGEMLREAARGHEPPARYVEGWPRAGDAGVVAELGGRPVGAAWWRRLTADDPGFGYVDDETPEIAIGVVPEHRGSGVGTVLLRSLHALARETGVHRLSLSVEHDNPARALYERVGYVEEVSDEGASTMVIDLT